MGAFINDIRTNVDTPEYQMVFQNIRTIREKMEALEVKEAA